jgi:alkylated DNA repair dioxygenase AlkB
LINLKKTKYPDILPWTKTLKIIRDLLERECNQSCNHLVLNRYENENDYIGYHRDKTKSLVPNSKVIVLSLGETRTMNIQEIYKVDNKNKTRKIFETEMIHGSLFELTLKTNLNHKHQIRKTKTSKKVRLGLTFRQVREFINIKTGKYYFK